MARPNGFVWKWVPKKSHGLSVYQYLSSWFPFTILGYIYPLISAASWHVWEAQAERCRVEPLHSALHCLCPLCLANWGKRTQAEADTSRDCQSMVTRHHSENANQLIGDTCVDTLPVLHSCHRRHWLLSIRDQTDHMSVEDYKKTKPNVSKYLLLLLLMMMMVMMMMVMVMVMVMVLMMVMMVMMMMTMTMTMTILMMLMMLMVMMVMMVVVMMVMMVVVMMMMTMTTIKKTVRAATSVLVVMRLILVLSAAPKWTLQGHTLQISILSCTVRLPRVPAGGQPAGNGSLYGPWWDHMVISSMIIHLSYIYLLNVGV